VPRFAKPNANDSRPLLPRSERGSKFGVCYRNFSTISYTACVDFCEVKQSRMERISLVKNQSYYKRAASKIANKSELIVSRGCYQGSFISIAATFFHRIYIFFKSNHATLHYFFFQILEPR